MAYNFIVEKTESVDWQELRNFFNDLDTQAIEAFPILVETNSDDHFIGISIPFSKLDKEADFWSIFLNMFQVLSQKFQLKIFDLHNGIYINKSDLPRVKKSLYG